MTLLDKYCIRWSPGQILWPNHNQTKCHLVAGLFQNEYVELDSNSYVCSTKGDIFHLILRYLKCSLTFHQTDSTFGGIFVNNTWTGSMAMIANNKADFIPQLFSMKAHRETIIDFGFWIPRKEIMSILSLPKQIVYEDPLKIFSGFSLEIWICILISMLCFGLFNLQCQQNSRKLFGGLQSLLSSYLDMLGILLGQGSIYLTYSHGALIRNLLFLWVFGTFILRQLFASDITALLLSRSEFTINYFDQFFHSAKEYRILIELNSIAHFMFIERYPQLEDKLVPILHDNVTSEGTIDMLIHDKFVLVTNRDQADKIKEFHYNLNLHVSREGRVSVLSNFAVRKSLNDSVRHRLNKLFKSINLFGLESKIDKSITLNRIRSALTSGPTASLTSANSMPTQESDIFISNVHSFIYIYLVGIILSALCFIMEIVFYSYHTH